MQISTNLEADYGSNKILNEQIKHKFKRGEGEKLAAGQITWEQFVTCNYAGLNSVMHLNNSIFLSYNKPVSTHDLCFYAY